MASFGTNEAIERIVREYSGMLLRLACTRLASTADAEEYLRQLSREDWSALKWLFPEEYGSSYDQALWDFYDKNYHERQQKALVETGLK